MTALLTIPETTRQKASLATQVIEDLTFRPVDPGRFQAELAEVARQPTYKAGGYFVFSDLVPGDYTLRVAGAGFQTWQRSLPVPPQPGSDDPVQRVLLELPGEDEVFVHVNRILPGNGNANPRIAFDPIVLNRPLPSGAAVLAKGFSGRLAGPLGLGPTSSAALQSVDGLEEGSLLRMVRSEALRLKFDPYSPAPDGLIRILGRVSGRSSAPLPGARIELLEINGAALKADTDSGLEIYTVNSPSGPLILGPEKDISTLSNLRGDYNIYLNPRQGMTLQSALLRATRDGLEPQVGRLEATGAKLRQVLDFELAPA